ncbi:MAG: polyphosphate:AMP phosphotransferase [Deltaproteobacteria bacterium]|nr:polyphosphate:AMP phosphotransferase [Deltaproteobacteria bacterium]
MFEAAEVGQKISKAEFDRSAAELRIQLLQSQQALRSAAFPLIVVVAGVDGGGKSETVKVLNEWLDPRHISTHAYASPSQEERERPEFWRYWRDLPAAGSIGVFLSSWYSTPILDRVHRRSGRSKFEYRLRRIADFEKALADDGALIVKLWFHLSRKAQKQRLKTLESDPTQRWRVSDRDWRHYELYERFVEAAERAIMQTSTAAASWCIIEGADPRYRNLTAMRQLHSALEQRFEQERRQRPTVAVDTTLSPEIPTDRESQHSNGQRTILSALDLELDINKKAYNSALAKQVARLDGLFRRARQQSLGTIVLFEGWDAAGKGGAIRRLLSGLDPRDYQVIPIAKPSDEEAAHHYLWRFWRHLPRSGRLTIFDRSWYGRVLVERVEGFARQAEWRRAFAEINDFEDQLVQHGLVVAKFWLQISKDEQLRRFEERAQTPFKAWKLTDEDWRNREKWEAYELAVNEMVERTSTHDAPWTLVEANSKRYARVKVVRTVCDALATRLGD